MDNNQTTPVQTQPVQPQQQVQPASSPADPTVTVPKKKFPIAMIAVAALVVIILGLGSFILFGQNKTTSKTDATPSPTTAMITQPEASPEASMDGMNTFVTADKSWQISYPEDVIAERQAGTHIGPAGVGETAVFYKHGPTQTTGTEFHDGLAVVVGTLKKPAATTLAAFVDEQNVANPEVPMTKTPQASITVGGVTGITTTVTSMGTAKLIYLPVPNNAELVYFFSVVTEGAAKATYQQMADTMLSSFKLL